MGLTGSKTIPTHPAVQYDTKETDKIACDVLVDKYEFTLMELKFLRYYFDQKCEGLQVYFEPQEHVKENGKKIVTKIHHVMQHMANEKSVDFDFALFVDVFSSIIHGDITKKAKFVFQLVDVNHDNFLEQSDISEFLSLFKSYETHEKYIVYQKEIEKFFDNPETTEDYFMKSISKYKGMASGFGLFEFYFDWIFTNIRELIEQASSGKKRGKMSKRNDTLFYWKQSDWVEHNFQIVNGLLIDIDPETELGDHIPLTSCKIKEITGNYFTLQIPEYHVVTFDAYNETERNEWVNLILYEILKREYNRFNSFAPIHKGCLEYWYINGKPFYQRLADALEQAKESIYLVCWQISPQVYLRRSNPPSIKDRFDNILLERAKKGVHIYMTLWNETKVTGSGLNSKYCMEYLNSLHPNFHVMAHPEVVPLIWGHHQKFICIDQDHAFQGGFDVCWGRWDDEHHRISDDCHLQMEWPGKDYFNPLIQGTDEVEKPHDDNLDREKYPRMTWHDAQSECCGELAREIAENFVERWNIHRLDILTAELNRTRRRALETLYPFIFRKSQPPSDKILKALPVKFHNFTPMENKVKMETCTVQNVRSITRWSGSYTMESSIYSAYIYAIRQAQHYVFIENQYYISNGAPGVQNRLNDELLDRIRWAIKEKRVFRVFIMIPITPDGNYKHSSTVRCIMYWQLNSLSRGGTSLIETFNNEFPDLDWRDYITVISMRNHGIICGKPTTEQVYTHSKIMVVDDTIAIIGSANTNDRSFLGDRDSELCQVITDESKVEIHMNNKKFSAGRFPHTFRLFIFRELFGQDMNIDKILDPVSENIWKMLQDMKKKNTEIYIKVFPYIPGDHIQKYSDIREKTDSFEYIEENLPLLEEIKGLVVEYPLEILKGETLYPTMKEFSHRNLSHNMFQ